LYLNELPYFFRRPEFIELIDTLFSNTSVFGGAFTPRGTLLTNARIVYLQTRLNSGRLQNLFETKEKR